MHMNIPLILFIIAFLKYAHSDPGLQCQCGRINKRVSSRTNGGNITKPHQYPWMALILHGPTGVCGGSLISSQHVLTAAHCVFRPHSDKRLKADHIGVKLGLHNKLDKKVPTIKVSKINLYDPCFKNTNVDESGPDIAILTLEKPVTFNDKIGPVCLPSNAEKLHINKTVTVTGWGNKFLKVHDPDPNLKEVNLSVVSNDICRKQNYTMQK